MSRGAYVTLSIKDRTRRSFVIYETRYTLLYSRDVTPYSLYCTEHKEFEVPYLFIRSYNRWLPTLFRNLHIELRVNSIDENIRKELQINEARCS